VHYARWVRGTTGGRAIRTGVVYSPQAEGGTDSERWECGLVGADRVRSAFKVARSALTPGWGGHAGGEGVGGIPPPQGQ